MAIKIPQQRINRVTDTTGVKTPDFTTADLQTIGEAGRLSADIGLTLQKQRNEAKLRETDTMLAQQLNDLKNGYAQKNGKDAYESQQDFDKAAQDLRNKAMAGLENDAQRRMFQKFANEKLTSAIQFGSAHAIKSLQEWNVSTIQAQSELHTQEAVAQYGTPQGAISTQKLMENIEDLGLEQDWSPEQIAVAQMNQRSLVAKTVVTSKIESDPAGAWRAYQDAIASGELTPTDAKAIEGRVTAAWDNYTVYEAARVLIAQAPGDLETQVIHARQVQDPEKQAKIMVQLRENARLERMMEERTQEEVRIRAWDRITELGPNAKIKDVPSAAEVGIAANKAMQIQVEKQQEGVADFKTDRTYEQQKILEFEADPEGFRKTYKRSDHVHKMRRDALDNFEKRIRKAPDDNKFGAKDVKTNAFAILGVAGKIDKLSDSKRDKQIAIGRDVDARVEAMKEEKKRDLTRDEMIRIEKNVIYDWKTDKALPMIEIDGSGTFSDDVYTPLEIRERQLNPVTAIKDSKGVPFSIQDIEDAIWMISRNKNDPDITDTEIKEFLKPFEE